MRYNANRFRKPVNDELRAVINTINIDTNGRLNADIYTHYKKLMKLDDKFQHKRRSSTGANTIKEELKVKKPKHYFNLPERPASTIK